MEVKEQLAQLLSTLKVDFLNKYTLFAKQEDFNPDHFVQLSLEFLRKMEIFHEKFVLSGKIPIRQPFVDKCKEKAQELSTDDPKVFLKKVEGLLPFLNGNGFLLVKPAADGERGPVVPHPINQQIVDGPLREQEDIISDRKKEISESDTAFKEETFKIHHGQLFITRSVFRDQLLENAIEAGIIDEAECENANEGIKNATTAQAFYDQMDAARTLYNSKIVPVIT